MRLTPAKVEQLPRPGFLQDVRFLPDWLFLGSNQVSSASKRRGGSKLHMPGLFAMLLALVLLVGSPRETPMPVPAMPSPSPVLVELFTSEGCSSCPPADALLIQLEKQQPVPNAQVIVLSQHVDYWNRLGWADPFSSEQFSRRQSEYAEAFGRDGIYTPQMIVDGQAEFVGSDASRARSAIAAAASLPKAALTVSFAEGASAESARVRAELGAAPPGLRTDTSEVMLAITETDLASSVARGENAGRHIRHTGVVRILKSLGRVNGAKPVFESEVKLPAAWQRKNLAAVVFVQDRKTRRTLAAGIARFPAR